MPFVPGFLRFTAGGCVGSIEPRIRIEVGFECGEEREKGGRVKAES